MSNENRPKSTWTRRITRCLIGIVVAAAIWLAAGFVVKSLAMNCMESRALHRAERYLEWSFSRTRVPSMGGHSQFRSLQSAQHEPPKPQHALHLHSRLQQ